MSVIILGILGGIVGLVLIGLFALGAGVAFVNELFKALCGHKED